MKILVALRNKLPRQVVATMDATANNKVWTKRTRVEEWSMLSNPANTEDRLEESKQIRDSNW